MFYNLQKDIEKLEYEESLKVIGSLSNLFSDAKEPYLHYRIAEKVFCKAFSSHDLSRGDVAFDTFKGTIGIGLKTFLAKNNKSFQKVAEFNKDKFLYENASPHKLISIVSKLRNERIKFAEKLYKIEKSIYHCVIRSENSFKIYEEDMDYVKIENICDVKATKSSIQFNDQVNDYTFNLSKSVLTKRFVTGSPVYEFDVKILENPLEDIKNCFVKQKFVYSSEKKILSTVYLPLYGKNKIVYPRSGLNQWNALGRKRDINEVYIPIPIKVHKQSEKFFPDRDTPFDLILPTGDILQVKVCQDNDKALMSYSNKALGKWILRDVLSLSEGEILTYDRLQLLGIDSVRIDKINNKTYEINFAFLGSFEDYIGNY